MFEQTRAEIWFFGCKIDWRLRILWGTGGFFENKNWSHLPSESPGKDFAVTWLRKKVKGIIVMWQKEMLPRICTSSSRSPEYSVAHDSVGLPPVNTIVVESTWFRRYLSFWQNIHTLLRSKRVGFKILKQIDQRPRHLHWAMALPPWIECESFSASSLSYLRKYNCQIYQTMH